MSRYSHTQPGTLSRVTFGLLIVLFVVLAAFLGRRDPEVVWVFGLLSLVMLVVALLFHSLTVEIERGKLRIRFGVGLIRKTIRVKDIASAEPVRNRWWYGWGIRLTPHGWLFNISGFEAVQLRLADGRQYRVGTDEPDRLVAAIEAAKRYR